MFSFFWLNLLFTLHVFPPLENIWTHLFLPWCAWTELIVKQDMSEYCLVSRSDTCLCTAIIITCLKCWNCSLWKNIGIVCVCHILPEVNISIISFTKNLIYGWSIIAINSLMHKELLQFSDQILPLDLAFTLITSATNFFPVYEYQPAKLCRWM